MRRMIERFVTDFPEPDSPTMPKVSPRFRSKLMPSTALTVPSSVSKYVRRSLTERRFPSELLIIAVTLCGLLYVSFSARTQIQDSSASCRRATGRHGLAQCRGLRHLFCVQHFRVPASLRESQRVPAPRSVSFRARAAPPEAPTPEGASQRSRVVSQWSQGARKHAPRMNDRPKYSVSVLRSWFRLTKTFAFAGRARRAVRRRGSSGRTE